MRRRLARALALPLTFVAAGTVISLASAAPVAAGSIVVGGFPVDVSQSPYTVALSSRDRFGVRGRGSSAGAWRSAAPPCSPPPTAWTRRCSAPPGAGARPQGDSGAYRAARGGRPGGRRTEGLGEPHYDGATNSGDFAVLSLAEPLPAASVIGMAGAGDPAYRAGTAATVYGWGTPRAPAATPAACTGRAYGCSPTRCARRRIPEAPTAPTAPRGCCARVRWPAGGTHVRGQRGPLVAQGRLIGLVSWGQGAAGRGARGLHPHLRRPDHAGVARGLTGLKRRYTGTPARNRRAAPPRGRTPPVRRPVPVWLLVVGREVSVLLVRSGLRSGQPLRLVLYLSGDLLEFRLELAPVVGAEEQFSTAQQDDAQVGLGAAAVAAIGGRQRARGGQNSSHVASSLARRAVVPGSTSNQPQNVPARGFSSKKNLRGGRLLPVGGECAVVRVSVSYGFAWYRWSALPAGLPVVHEDVPGA